VVIGVGWAMMAMSFMVCIYYNMIIAYILRYLFASFTTTLPWQSCRPEWMQYGCYERLQGVQNTTSAANTTLVNATSTCTSNGRRLLWSSVILVRIARLSVS